MRPSETGHGPNPWKVVLLLEELEIPYVTNYLGNAELKQPPFEAINPNGRVPAIEDPNTGIILWEVGDDPPPGPKISWVVPQVVPSFMSPIVMCHSAISRGDIRP